MIKIYAVVSFIVACVGACVVSVNVYIESRIKSGLEKCHATIDDMNDSIKELALDSEKLKKHNANTALREGIAEKYKYIKVKDKTCEAELKGVKDALHTFYAGTR